MNQSVRKFLSGILLAVTLLCLLCSCQPESTTTSSTSSNLPQLKIGVDTLKPFYYIDESGDPAGIDAEIAMEACHRAGYEAVFVNIPWDEKDEYLRTGKVDCLWNAFSEDGRENLYTWTTPYMESNLRVIVDERAPDKTAKDLVHSPGVAVRAGSKTEEIFLNSTEEPTLTIYSCNTFESAKTSFIKGYTSALSCHEAVLQQIVDEYPGLYRFLDGSLMTVHLGAAFDKNSPSDAFQPLNDALTEMKTDGTIDFIIEKYTHPKGGAAE